MTVKKQGTLEVLASLLVLFTAMLDPRISAALAVVALAGIGLFRILKKT